MQRFSANDSILLSTLSLRQLQLAWKDAVPRLCSTCSANPRSSTQRMTTRLSDSHADQVSERDFLKLRDAPQSRAESAIQRAADNSLECKILKTMQ